MRVFAAALSLVSALWLGMAGRFWWRADPRLPKQRTVGIAILILLASVEIAAAKPSRVEPDRFTLDRYDLVIAQGASARDMTEIMRCPVPCIRKTKHHRKWKKRWHIAAPTVRAFVPLPRVRPQEDEAQADAYRVIARLLAEKKVVRPLGLVEGAIREVKRALSGKSLDGIVAPLAAKILSVASLCPGTTVISTVRPGAVVRGSGRPSLHRYGKAVDIAGPYGCLYAALKGFPGGVSTDAHRVRHIHISYDKGGREWGSRFAHFGGSRRTRYARHHKRYRYARAG